MKKCKLHIVLMFLFVAMLLSSCTIPLTCELYNNTSMPIQIIQKSYYGEKQEKHFSIMPNESMRLGLWLHNSYVVNTENVSWSYGPPSTGYNEYYEFVGFWPFVKRVIRVQLNEDGKIFLIKNGKDFPIPDNVEQPEGYPLTPNITYYDDRNIGAILD